MAERTVLDAMSRGGFHTGPWGDEDNANLRLQVTPAHDADVADCRSSDVGIEIARLLNTRFNLLTACEEALAQLNGYGQDPRGMAIRILVSALVSVEVKGGD